MCTVTLVPHRDGVRIVCNRDERRDRAFADPPEIRAIRHRRAVWPVDPVSGGTWIGVNDAGVAMVMLNRNPAARPQPCASSRSRGTIIPPLLAFSTLDTVLDSIGTLEGHEFEPFTLVVLQHDSFAVVRNAARRIATRRSRISRPVLVTSSSLGDNRVSGPRRTLFERMVLNASAPLTGQAAFHRHTWPARPEISVQMSRPDALTVSRTVLDVNEVDARLEYVPLWGTGRSRRRVSLRLAEPGSR